MRLGEVKWSPQGYAAGVRQRQALSLICGIWAFLFL